jgi:hypothetical protein
MNIAGAIGLFLLATVKFLVSPPVGLASGIDFWYVVLIQFAGGVTGVIVFYFVFHAVLERARERMARKRAEAMESGETPKRIFTKRNRSIVRWKQKLGFYGVVFIALPFASLPIEGLILAKFFKHERMLFPLVILSVACWAFILTAFYKFFFDGIKAYFL